MPAPNDTAALGPVGTAADPALVEAKFDLIFAYLQGGVDTFADNSIAATKLLTAVGASLGLNAGGTTRRGVTRVDTEQTTTSTSYTLLGTPDRVQSILMPSDGLLVVSYRALAKVAGAGVANVGVFVDGIQTVMATGVPCEGACAGSTNYGPVAAGAFGSNAGGISWMSQTGADSVDSGLGQAIGHNAFGGGSGGAAGGGFLLIEAAAGTHDVSIRFKAAAGQTVSAKNRRLRVMALALT